MTQNFDQLSPNDCQPHEFGQTGQITLDKQVILIEQEQPVSREDLTVFTDDFDACIAHWFQQIEKLDASGQRPTRRSLVNIQFLENDWSTSSTGTHRKLSRGDKRDSG